MDYDMIVTLSFSSYSTNGLASIAVKVTDEFNQTLEGLFDEDDFEFSLDHQADAVISDHNFLNRSKTEEKDDLPVKVPLKQLFAYDREEYCSSSSSFESESLTEIRTSIWKKTNSFATGGRRKWKGWNKIICDLLRRSNSDGGKDVRKSGAGKIRATLATPMEVFYVRSKAEKEGVKRKSYLPYRQQLLGFFGRKY